MPTDPTTTAAKGRRRADLALGLLTGAMFVASGVGAYVQRGFVAFGFLCVGFGGFVIGQSIGERSQR